MHFFFFDFEDLSEQISQIGQKLVPSWPSLVLQCVCFFVLMILVCLFLYKPIKKMLNERQTYVVKQIKEAEENASIAKKNAEISSSLILESQKQANDIILKANEMAIKEKENIIINAQNDIEKMKKNAELDIEKAKEDALEEIHDQMVDVALSASSEILKRNINSEDNVRLTKNFIEELERND